MSQLAKSVLSLLLALSILPAQGGVYSEKQVKAVFLYNFSSFVQWPDEAFESDSSPIRYCVTGDDALENLVRTVVHGERSGLRRLEVVGQPADLELQRCHVLFLGTKDEDRLAEVLRIVDGSPVLTVSDDVTAGGSSAMIRLSSRRRRVHPLVDLDAVENGRLRISAKLLQLATVSRSSREGDRR